jgi:Rubrerythrin
MTWVCTICGWESEDETKPEVCPVCGAGEEAFEEKQ